MTKTKCPNTSNEDDLYMKDNLKIIKFGDLSNQFLNVFQFSNLNKLKVRIIN